MKKLYVFAFGLLVATSSAYAEQESKYELRSAISSIGYSNFYGFFLNGELSAGYRLTNNWQIVGGMGGFISSNNTGNYRSFNLGARYNFGSDFSNAYFLGAGADYGNRSNVGDSNALGFAGYVEFGKRFRLNDSGSLSYAPYVSLTSRGDGAVLRVQPLSLSYSF